MGDENWDEDIKGGSGGGGGFGSAPAPAFGGANDGAKFGFGGLKDTNNNDTKGFSGFGGGDSGERREGGGFGGNRRGGGFGGGFGGGGGDRGGFGNRDDGDRPRRGGFGGGGFGGGNREGGGFGGNREGGRGFGGNREGGFGGNREGGFGGGNREGGFGGGNREGGGFGGNREGGRGFGGNRDGGFGGNREGGFGGGNREGGGFGSQRRSGFGNDGDNHGEERKSGGGFGNRNGGFGGGFGGGFRSRDGENGGGGFGSGGGGGRSFGNRDGSRGRPGGDGQERGERGGFRSDREGGDQGGERREVYMPTYDDSEEALFQHISVGVNFAKQNEIPVALSGEGKDDIKPIEKFTEAGLSELLLANIKRCQYEISTPVQKYSIPIVLARRDLMACAQTGSGKTAAYLVPIMTNILSDGIESSALMGVQSPQALILSPTRELAIQIFQECKKFSHGSIIKSAILYGGVNTRFQVENLNRGCNILIATPGRLLDVLERGQVSLQKVKYFVLDEADRMLDLGFEKDVRTILEKGQVNKTSERVTLMYSATFPSEIQKLAQDFLSNYLFLAVGIVGGANTDVEQIVYKVGRFEKRDKVVSLINEIGNERVMIFLEQKKQADILAFYLLQNKYPSTSIHGDRMQSQRETALADFKSGKSKIIVCTSVAARGLDIDKVGYVINYDLPKSIDEYVHRIGRTGRCGNLGKSISFFDPDSESDRALARQLVMTLRQAHQNVPDWLSETAEGSHGAAYTRDLGADDMREQMGKMTFNDANNKPADVPAAATAVGGAAEEAWD